MPKLVGHGSVEGERETGVITRGENRADVRDLVTLPSDGDDGPSGELVD